MTTEFLFPLADTQHARPAAPRASSPSPVRTSAHPSERESARLHRIHAAPASGQGGRSFDLGGYRWRPTEAGKDSEDARAIAHRLALCWNLCEGIRTETLEAGALRKEADATAELVEAIERGEPPERLRALTAALRRAGGLVEAGIDRSHGRLHDCPSCEGREP
jgi:hypothetical protein